MNLLPTPDEAFTRVQQRAQRLAQEKSYLQLVNDLMGKLSQVPGLENTAEALVRLLGETIGGTNLALYYWADGRIQYVDMQGLKRVLEALDDELAIRASTEKRLCEHETQISPTPLTDPAPASASSWAHPLLVGDELIGVIKADGVFLPGAEAHSQLGPFFGYAALVLKNEVLSHSRLVEANKKLRQMNEQLKVEMAERSRQQRFFEALLESLNAAVVACDAAGRVTVFNRTSRQIRDLPEEPLFANQWASYFHLHQADGRTPMASDEAPLTRALRGETVEHLETVVLVPGRPVSTLLATGRRITDATGATLGAVVAMQDITDRKRLESQLRHAQKLEAVGQLAAGIAHELNTPAQFVSDSIGFLADAVGEVMRLIGTYQRALGVLNQQSVISPALLLELEEAEQAADLSFLTENVPPAFDRVHEGIKRIANIVMAMKEFAHPDLKEKSPSDLNRALRATVTIARNEYKYVADLDLDLGELPSVTCHVSELNQVFLNLLVNAAHAISDAVGSTGKRGAIRVKTRQVGEQVRIDVSDTGCGIPEAIRDRVFDPFFTTKGVGRGSGQGLAIARAIVVGKHGGTLTFESVMDRGTTFTIHLPISRPELAAAGVAA